MKNLHVTLCSLAALVYSVCASAQNEKIPINEPDYNKPRLFSNLPGRIGVSLSELELLVEAPVGSRTRMNLAAETVSSYAFDGDVVSAVSKYENRIQSVVIRSSNFNGASLTVSKIRLDDGTFTYTGRIISFQHGDLFELKQEAGGWVFVKRNYYELINE